VKYGLLATILAHFASNATILAGHKVQRINMVDGLIVFYATLCATVSYVLMKKPIADVLPWFADSPVFRLQGWGFWDYVKVSVFISASSVILFGLLLYDRGEAGKKESDKNTGIFSYVIGIPIIIGLLYGVYALLGLFITNVPYRVLVLAILFTFVKRGASGSAMSRTFWSGLPDTYITICILQALGFWPALGWVAVETVVHAPGIILRKIDD
jgi:hypothetical protein